MYDYIVIGSGPAGLAFAHCCSKIGKKVLLIERENDIGGCHRVRRVNGLFTEHGPRVYSSTYRTMIMILEDMSFKFEDFFTEYNFKIGEISGQTVFNTLSLSELFLFAVEFVKLLFNNKHGKSISVLEFMENHKFTTGSIDIIDRICRLTDGTSSEFYTLNQFLQLVNQQIIYKLYQPKYPNDLGIFNAWKTYLLNTNFVDFQFDIELHRLELGNDNTVNTLYLHDLTDNSYYTLDCQNSRVILAIPPKNMDTIFINSNIEDQELSQWSSNTAYLDYITIIFHWDTKLKLPKVYGFTKTDWGIAFIVLSDYMKFNESQTVISVGITRKDFVSTRLNKKVDDCTQQELIDETFYQLKQSFPDLQTPTHSVISPGNVQRNGKWTCLDTAFIAAANQPYLNPKLGENLYTLGTHNGTHFYKFTSMESAITNSVVLANELEPYTKNYFLPKKSLTIRDLIFYILLFICILFLIRFNS